MKNILESINASRVKDPQKQIIHAVRADKATALHNLVFFLFSKLAA